MSTRLLVIAASCLAVGGAATVGWKRSELLTLLRLHRATTLLAASAKSSAAGKFQEAQQQALAAYQLHPANPKALRQAAAAALDGNDPAAFRLALALFTQSATAPEDKAFALQVCRLSGNAGQMPTLYGNLTPAEQQHPQVALEMSRHGLECGNFEAAIQFLARHEILATQDPSFGAVLAFARLHSADSQVRRQAGETIAHLVTAPNHPAVRDLVESLAFAPLDRLISSGLPNDPAELLRPFADHPSERAILAAETVQIIRHPGERDWRLEALTQRFGPSPAFCRWLNLRGESERVVNLLREEVAMHGDLALYQERLQALLQLKRLDEATKFLETRHPSQDPIRHECLRARLNQHLNQTDTASKSWEAAMELASLEEQSNRFLEIAESARQAGANAVARRAMVQAIHHPKGTMPSSQELLWLIEYLGREGKYDDLFFLTRRLLSQEQNHPVLLNNALYLLVLEKGKPPPQSAEVMAALVREYPDVPAFRTTLALVLATEKKFDQALNTFQSAHWSPAHSGDTDRLIYATVLRLNGKETEARQVEVSLHLENVKAAEQQLLRNLSREAGLASVQPGATSTPSGEGRAEP